MLQGLLPQADCIVWTQRSILQLCSAELAASGCLTSCPIRHRLLDSILSLQENLSLG